MKKKTVWVHKCTGKAYETKREAEIGAINSMSFEDKLDYIKKKATVEEILTTVNQRGVIYVFDILVNLIQSAIEKREIKVSYKWRENKTGKEFYFMQDLHEYIYAEYDIEKIIDDYINSNYEPTEIIQTAKEKTVKEFMELVERQIIKDIIQESFTYIETEVE